MKLTPITKKILVCRKERKGMEEKGYLVFSDYEGCRGKNWDKKIIDAKISRDGKEIYYKLGNDNNE